MRSEGEKKLTQLVTQHLTVDAKKGGERRENCMLSSVVVPYVVPVCDSTRDAASSH